MEFNKPYNRTEFVTFLRTKFLPEDFVQEEEPISLSGTNYATSAIKLGTSEFLQLVVYEVKHNSRHDARVGLSRDAFRMLADEYESRALVLFVPEDSNDNYRFSFIELSLTPKDDSSRLTRTYSNPRRYSYYLGKGISYYTPNKYLNEAGRVQSVNDLKERFSVEVLTKAFYKELSNWYAWAIDKVHYPNDIEDPTDNEKYNHESTIRLITRLIFVWFLKQRGLIPWQFFDEQYIAEHLIKGFTPNAYVTLFGKSEESHYYKGILQNLFFAMLNSPLTADGSDEVNQRHFRKLNDNGTASRSDFDNNKLMRYEDLFIDPQHFVDLANSTVPFLNGGLFECLDDKINGMYLDAFTDNKTISRQLIIPDYLFFGEEIGKNIDLSKFYGDATKNKESARGIIDILKRYNFTVEENTPFDQDVSLDPELLGKAFENLLAAFNPETQTTARKQTGSFYTPREIVQYMVDESLVAHLCRTVDKTLEPKFRQLVQYTDEDLGLSLEQRQAIMQSLYNCKVLDPACGSGAFPVGMLQQMVHILNRIDPDNAMWKEMMKKNAGSEASEAYMAATDEERKEILSDIDRSFDESVNRPDYARKLYLIENCIYGVDIQPIAIQISKLRFFISLVVDQKINNNPADNFGIRPLPNLEAKFVAANSLLDLEKKEVGLFDLDEIKAKENLLKIAKHKIFSAKTVKTKRKWKERVAVLRQEIADLLFDADVIGNDTARELASWDMFSQNISSPFFNAEWMFGIENGFDIVIANPPYIDSETMVNTMPEMRTLYSNRFDCAQGNWDMFIPFIELGNKLLKQGGIQSYIVPNKLIAAKYASAVRTMLSRQNIKSIRDYGAVSVFEAAVYPCVFVVQKTDADEDIIFKTMATLTDVSRSANIPKSTFRKDILWDKYFIESEKLAVIMKISDYQTLGSLAPQIYGAATVGEAYDIKTYLKDGYYNEKAKSYKFINTGTIDRYRSLWGIEQTRYIKGAYVTPYISATTLNDYSVRRYKHASSAKIILAGMSKMFEAYLDCNGDYLAGKSTTIILGELETLKYWVAIINSSLMSFWLNTNFNSLKMQGGYINVGVNETKQIPIAENNELKGKIVQTVNSIIHKQSTDVLADISSEENLIDCLVYKLYQLSYDDILAIGTPISLSREEYANLKPKI
jgi:hypothetical protein